MSEARDQILGAVRRSLGRGPMDEAARETLDKRLADHPRALVPAQDGNRSTADRFVERVEAVAGTVARVEALADVPDAVADYLAGLNLPAGLRHGDDPLLAAIDWSARPALQVERGASGGDDLVGLSAGFAGIAETGTVMLLSGPDNPTTLNFLPATEIIVLTESRLVDAPEDAWDRLRAAGAMPRAVNLVAGPSRTGDIEQTIYLGAHGPLNLHIILVARDPD